MNARPGGCPRCDCAVVVAAAVVHVPIDSPRAHSLLIEPVAKRDTIKIRLLARQPRLHGNGESSRGAKAMNLFLKPAELISLLITQANGRLNSVLPTSIEKQALLW